MSQAIDWDQLDMIADGFSPDFVEIYHEFAAEVPALLNTLREALAAGNPEAVARTAHQLKGSAANFGFVGVSGPMGELELEAKAGSLDTAAGRIATATEGFETALAEVKTHRGV
jgi:HPt (histidine-containing phosphotransfer) domain-containing protein